MNTALDQLLTNVYELEGLLLVMKRHNDDIPSAVIDRFRAKAQVVARAANALAANALAANKSSVSAPLPVTPPPFPQVPSIPSQEVSEGRVATSLPPQYSEAAPVFAVEEAPAGPPDITEAFSINDRFLFQRELFDGDKQRFDDAIAVMQRLGNIDKIQEFMTDILGLNPSDEVVKEFVRLVDLSLKG